MKRKVFCLMTVALLLFTSCINCNWGEKIAPSKTMAKKEYKMEAFTKMEVNVLAHVKIVQGQDDDYRVVLSAPDNYLDFYEFKVDNDELEIGFVRGNLNIESGKVKIMVYTPTLREVENKGVCTIETDSLKGDILKVDNEGVGEIKMKGLNMDKIAVECSGIGGIDLRGVANWVSLDCSGVGGISAKHLKARRVKGEVSGVGGIDCYASDSLKAVVTGVGSLRYGGNPAHKQLRRDGVGSIDEL